MTGCEHCHSGIRYFLGNSHACQCPTGVSLRLSQNREALMPTSPILKASQRLRDAGYHEPILPQHVCAAGCDTHVSVCGGICLACHDELMVSRKATERKDARFLYAVLLGLVAGLPVWMGVFMAAGWM